LRVERRFQGALEEGGDIVAPGPLGLEPARRAGKAEPTLSHPDMADLVLVDDLEYGRRRRVARFAQFGDHYRRHVEAARFQNQGHDGEPRHQIMACRHRRFPEAVMGRQVAVSGVQFRQALRQQGEVARLFAGDENPVGEEAFGQFRTGETGDDVPGQIDGVELDMGQGVE
jgi:hypothetical protein